MNLKTAKRICIRIGLTLLCLAAAVSAHALECIDSQELLSVNPGVNQPSDIAIGPGGDLYVVDGVNNRVIVLDSRGEKKFSFGRFGKGVGEFSRPLGIDVAEDGKVFVADTGNHRVQSFDPAGNFLHMFTIRTGPGEKPSDPVDLLVSRLNGNLYISDNDNHKIRVYNPRGEAEFEWGKFGEGPGEFRYPGILAANKYNQIFVVDVLNTRVQVFDPFGNYISEIGVWGVFPGSLFRPKGVVVDKKNRVFVSDSYMGVIQVFTSMGRFEGVLCEKGVKRQLTTPVGLAFDGDRRRLFVVEMRANRLRILKVED